MLEPRATQEPKPKGYRIYYGLEEQTVILLLCGGDKSSQAKDIEMAKQNWKTFKKDIKDGNERI